MSKALIAKKGYDVSNTDERNFLLNQKSIFKIAYTGNTSITYTLQDDGSGGGFAQATISVPHNLGYVPISFVFMTDWGVQIPAYYNVSDTVQFFLSYSLDSSNLNIDILDFGYNGSIGDTFTWHFRYQIMYDKIY